MKVGLFGDVGRAFQSSHSKKGPHVGVGALKQPPLPWSTAKDEG